MKNRLRLIFLVVALLPEVILLIVFHSRNLGFNGADAADPALVTQAAYLDSLSNGFISALKTLYMFRAFRPVIHPIFGYPFMLVFGGNLHSAIAWTSGAFYLLFLFSVTALLWEFLPPLESAMGTILIGCSPWIFSFATNYMVHIYFLAFSFFGAWCLIKSKYLMSWPLSLFSGIVFGATMCCRAEGVWIMGFPLLFYLVVMKKKKLIHFYDLAWLFLSLCITGIFFGVGFVSKAHSLAQTPVSTFHLGIVSKDDSFIFLLPYYFVIQSILFSVYFRWRRLRHSYFWLFFSSSQIIPVLWFAPALGVLWNWIYQCTYGPLEAQEGMTTLTGEKLAYLKSIFGQCNGPCIAVLIALGAVGIGIGIYRRKAKSLLTKNAKFWIGIILVWMLVPIVIGSTTLNSFSHYFLGMFIFLEMTVLTISLSPNLPARSFRLVTVTLLAALQIYYLGLHVESKQAPSTLTKFFDGPQWLMEPWTSPEPLSILTKKVAEAIPASAKALQTLFVLTVPHGDWRDQMGDAVLMTILAKNQGFSLDFKMLDLSVKDLSAEIRWVENFNPDYFVIEENDLPQKSMGNTAVSKIGLRLNQLLKSTTATSLKPIAVIPWNPRYSPPGKVFLIEAKTVIHTLNSEIMTP